MKKYGFLIVLLVLLFQQPVSAQKDLQKDLQGDAQEGGKGVGIFSGKREYGEFMRAVKSNPELAPMVGMINDIVLQQPIGSTGRKYQGSSGPIGLLNSENVRKELDLVDQQYEELQSLSTEIQKRAATEIRNLDFSNVKNVSVKIRGIQRDMEKDIENLLLPHQVKRLRQIHVRSRLRGGSLARLLTSDPVKSDLELTEDQSEELIESEKEIEAELQEKIAKLRAEAREELLDRLKPEQRKKADELLGDAFEFERKSERKKVEKSDKGKPKAKKLKLK